MSLSTPPTKSQPTSNGCSVGHSSYGHLRVFRTKPPTASDIDSDRESDDESSDDESIGLGACEPEMERCLKVGDCVTYYEGGHEGRIDKLKWGIVVSIKTLEDICIEGDHYIKNAHIELNKFVNFSFHQNKVTVYRLDDNNVLRDVTNGIPTCLISLPLKDGTLDSVYNDGDRMGDIINRTEDHLNETMPGKEGQRYLMNGKSSDKEENTDLNTIMTMIIQKIKDDKRELQRLYEEKEARKEAKQLQSGMSMYSFAYYLVIFYKCINMKSFSNRYI